MLRVRVVLFLQAAFLGVAVLPSSGAPVLDSGLPDCEPKIYWTHAGSDSVGPGIQRSNLDGTEVETLVTEELLAPWPLEIDPTGGKMYWGDVNQERIQRANLDGTLVETVVEGPFTFIDGPAGLAFDPISGMLYWTDFVFDKISRTNLTTGVTEALISTGLQIPLGIALDLDSGWMYWVDSAAGTIQRANLNGSGVVELVADLDNPRDVDLDVHGGKMYWVDLFGGVFRANLDGTEPELLMPNLGVSHYLTLDLANGKVYWGEGTGVSRANLDGSDIERGVVSTFPLTVFGVAVVPEGATLGDFSGDSQVNLDDVVSFHDCLSGPDVPLDAGCCDADFDGNGIIDLADVAGFQVAFNGGI